MGREAVVIPARFLLTIGNAIAIIMALYHEEANATASLGDNPSQEDRNEAKRHIRAAVAIGILANAVELIGMGLGFTLFFARLSFFQICLHFASGIYVCWYIVDAWAYETLWQIIILCNLPTTLAEIAVVFGIFVLRIVPFDRDD